MQCDESVLWKVILNEINKGSAPFRLLFQLTFCLSLSSCFLFLSFISSKTEDWGYLNEDGELGLAYQGLKQVARSNTLFFSTLLLLLSPPFSFPSCFFLLLCCCHVVLDRALCPLWEQLGAGFPNCRNWDLPVIFRGVMVPAGCCWWWLLSLMPELDPVRIMWHQWEIGWWRSWEAGISKKTKKPLLFYFFFPLH